MCRLAKPIKNMIKNVSYHLTTTILFFIFNNNYLTTEKYPQSVFLSIHNDRKIIIKVFLDPLGQYTGFTPRP